MQPAWRYVAETETYERDVANVEGYVTHNGDLDYFDIQGARGGPMRRTEGRQVWRTAY